MSTLQVVCLISGGKDSLFSILHCLKNEHNVVAIANLHPPMVDGANAVEDMDSFMYQTVGHTVVPLYEAALGLPLYRQEINGTAVNQEKCYGPAGDGDETEALVPLLRKVMAHHPEVNAVSTGAILSDYQRTRVESVALRLGLVPLSYLWQWPNLASHAEDALLYDMTAVGQDSRIIKVASGGLDERMLWQNVADPGTISRLNKAVKRFGATGDGAVLGEGGEYETLAISGPAPLWKGRIVVESHEREAITGEAGSATMKISKARVVEHTRDDDMSSLREPDLLEPRFRRIFDEISQEGDQHHSIPNAQTEQSPPISSKRMGYIEMQQSFDRPQPQIFLPSMVGVGSTAADQMGSIMDQAISRLQQHSHSLGEVAYTSIIVRDMADFASINAIYGTYFTAPNPPARATIASASVLPEGKHLMVSFTSVKNRVDQSRTGLHVQSRSYWAPANIGPYSQAVRIADCRGEGVTYIAGQIPLIPASMELPLAASIPETGIFSLQAVLALQHLDRIGRVMQVGRWAHVAAFITKTPADQVGSNSSTAFQVWEAYKQSSPQRLSSVNKDKDDAEDDAVNENDSFDVWHATFGDRQDYSAKNPVVNTAAFGVTYIDAESTPLYLIQVDALPRGSQIEWLGFGDPVTGQAARAEILHLQHLLHIFRNQMI